MIKLNLFNNSRFDRGAGKVKEALWMLCKGIFFLTPFPWPSSLRVFFLRSFGSHIGQGMVIRSGVNISFPWRFIAGDHVWIGEDVAILSLAQVTLGSNVCISQRAYLCSGSHDWRKETFDLIVHPIQVEDGVWIAAMAFVGAGVTVGQGCVVSAGAMVTRSLAPDSIARGNPAYASPKEKGGWPGSQLRLLDQTAALPMFEGPIDHPAGSMVPRSKYGES